MTAPFDALDLPRRPRRLRASAATRALVRETVLTAADLVQPLFVVEAGGAPEPIASMPGQVRWPLDRLGGECARLASLGIRAVALFPKLPASSKSPEGDEALNPQTLVLRAVAAVKAAAPSLTLITDIALDPYTTHGHDGLLTADGTDIRNDATVARLAEMATLHAAAGVDLVAPSDMMDGRVGAIRTALDAAGHTGTGILAYTAKYASAYYGPFRDAVGSHRGDAPPLDKSTYQMDPANSREALVEAALDAAEGADILMVKPAGPYLDIIHRLRQATDLPVAAYQVSGEYAQLHAAAQNGWLDLRACRNESLMAIKRAGADLILTYFAAEFAEEFASAEFPAASS
mgnify:CR=1 FL=1